MNIQRYLLAFSLCLAVLIMQPYYMEWLGYESDYSTKQVQDNDIALNQPPSQNNTVINEKTYQKNSAFEDQNYPIPNNERIIKIKTNSFSAEISSIGGGSYKSFILYTEDALSNHKYLGGYNDAGIYEDSMQVSLINPNSCAGCISLFNEGMVTKNFQPIRDSFTITNLPPNKNDYFIEPEDSLLINFSLFQEKSNSFIKKTMVFYGNKYKTSYSIKGENLPENSYLGLSWFGGLRTTEKGDYSKNSGSGMSLGYIPYEEGLITGENTEIIGAGESSISIDNNVAWSAIKNKYFICALLLDKQNGMAKITSSSIDVGPLINLPVFDASITSLNNSLNGSLYLGPLDINHIKKLNWNLDTTMNFGWAPVRPFSKLVLWVLQFLHETLKINYGYILILFAFIIRFVTGPLTKKSFVSQQKIQALQPKIKKMNKQFKDDPKRQQKALIDLYRQEGVNPVGGCLPMLLQMPLLFALFTVFRSTIEFRGANFIWWITDLSKPDYILDLPFSIPIYGDGIAVIPILFGITMVYNMKNSMATMDPAQKPLMYIFNGFFVLLFNSFPSGLNLYYTTYNILSILQQRSLKKTLSV